MEGGRRLRHAPRPATGSPRPGARPESRRASASGRAPMAAGGGRPAAKPGPRDHVGGANLPMDPTHADSAAAIRPLRRLAGCPGPAAGPDHHRLARRRDRAAPPVATRAAATQRRPLGLGCLAQRADRPGAADAGGEPGASGRRRGSGGRARRARPGAAADPAAQPAGARALTGKGAAGRPGRPVAPMPGRRPLRARRRAACRCAGEAGGPAVRTGRTR